MKLAVCSLQQVSREWCKESISLEKEEVIGVMEAPEKNWDIRNDSFESRFLALQFAESEFGSISTKASLFR